MGPCGEVLPQTFALCWTASGDGELISFLVASDTSPEGSLLAHLTDKSKGRPGLSGRLVRTPSASALLRLWPCFRLWVLASSSGSQKAWRAGLRLPSYPRDNP